MAVKHGPCLQTLKNESRLVKPNARGNFHGAMKDGFGEAVVACDMPEPCHDSLSKTALRGTFQGGRRRGRQRKMLYGQYQRVDFPAYARTAHKGLLHKRLEEDHC